MNYNFPVIKNISDVLPHIEGRNEFKVMRKGWYTTICYVVALEDTFPLVKVSGGSAKMRAERELTNSMLRECRGLVFDSDSGVLLSRPYHKFFNVNERVETLSAKVNLEDPHVILEKLDGSMVRPIPLLDGNGWRLGTKAGITDVSMNAEEWVAKKPNYINLIGKLIAKGITPIFEWCSRKNRIVIDYPEDRLVLTGARENLSGTYIAYDELLKIAAHFDIDVVQAYSGVGTCTMDFLLSQVNSWKDSEGVVGRFDSGHMFKIKAEDYVLLHRSKEAISREKNVIAAVVNDQIDDLLPLLSESDSSRLRAFQKAFWIHVDDVVNGIVDLYLAEGLDYGDSKSFAQMFALHQPKHLQPLLFALRRREQIKPMLIKHIAKSTSSQTQVDETRWAWGGLKWTD